MVRVETLEMTVRGGLRSKRYCMERGCVVSRHSKVKDLMSISIKLTPFRETWFVHVGNRDVYYGKKAAMVGCETI